MTSHIMVLQSQLELMIKIAQKRPDINKSMVVLLPMVNNIITYNISFQQITCQLLTFSKNLTRLVA